MAVAIAVGGATAAAGAEARSATAAGVAGLEPPVGEGEERRTRGWKARPPRVFTMLEPEKEKKWRGGGGGGGGGASETGNGDVK